MLAMIVGVPMFVGVGWWCSVALMGQNKRLHIGGVSTPEQVEAASERPEAWLLLRGYGTMASRTTGPRAPLAHARAFAPRLPAGSVWPRVFTCIFLTGAILARIL